VLEITDAKREKERIEDTAENGIVEGKEERKGWISPSLLFPPSQALEKESSGVS
jgi:hypothetical protein